MTNITVDYSKETIAPPKYMLVQPNLTCNLRCQHCHLWRNTDPTKRTDRYANLRLEAVRELATINPKATVITCGGEPLHEPQHYFDLCRVARESGLLSMSVINGTLTNTQEQADQLLRDGADEISLSLDHPRADVHDQMRGKKGSYQKTVRTIRMLLDARRRTGLTRKIYVMLMVCDVNSDALDETYDLVLRKIGADKLKLNFLQPTISCSTQKDMFWVLHTKKMGEGKILEDVDMCEKKYHLNLNPRWKENVQSYLESIRRYHAGGPLKTTTSMCNSYERNVVVEIEAKMRLCFSSKFPGMLYSQQGDLAKFWYSPETDLLRQKMKLCRDFCGICHTFKREPATREAANRILGMR